MIPKSTEYALIIDGTVIAKGSKKLILSRRKKEGGQILRSPSSKVGDKI